MYSYDVSSSFTTITGVVDMNIKNMFLVVAAYFETNQCPKTAILLRKSEQQNSFLPGDFLLAFLSDVGSFEMAVEIIMGARSSLDSNPDRKDVCNIFYVALLNCSRVGSFRVEPPEYVDLWLNIEGKKKSTSPEMLGFMSGQNLIRQLNEKGFALEDLRICD